MRTHEIVAWALRAIEQAKAGQPYEDSRVEFKSIWIDARDAARHICGHANAARGEPVLWLMGVTPTGEVSGVQAMELANWYPQVKSHFDDACPELIDVNIRIGDVTAVALVWNTEPAPFVFKTGRGDVPREVLYRHGTRTEAASRSQLIRILSPLAAAPTLELIGGSVGISRLRNFEKKQTDRLSVRVEVELFVIQSQNNESIFANHRTELKVGVAGQKQLNVHPIQFRSRANRSPSDSLPIKGAAELDVSSYCEITVPSNFTLDAQKSPSA